MALMATYKAVEYLLEHGLNAGHDVVVYNPQSFVVQGSVSWIRKWRTNGWKKINGKPVENQDVWQRLSPLIDRLGASYQHKPSHPLVREARGLAVRAATTLSANKRGEDPDAEEF